MKVVPLIKGCFQNKHGWTQVLVKADVGETAVGLLNEQVYACRRTQVTHSITRNMAGNSIYILSMKLWLLVTIQIMCIYVTELLFDSNQSLNK